MNPAKIDVRMDADENPETLDFSDLLGAGQAFPADPNTPASDALIDAHCNKIGTESCC